MPPEVTPFGSPVKHESLPLRLAPLPLWKRASGLESEAN
jgi:hypothetical protein